jgi:hypothetical protein
MAHNVSRAIMACDRCGIMRLVSGPVPLVDDAAIESPCLTIRRDHPGCPGVMRFVGEVLFKLTA